jgi:hypothetical protein
MSEAHGNASDPHGHAPPALPEPKTPMWLPALGAVLFLTVGLIWGLTPSSKDKADSSAGTRSAPPAADAGTPAR